MNVWIWILLIVGVGFIVLRFFRPKHSSQGQGGCCGEESGDLVDRASEDNSASSGGSISRREYPAKSPKRSGCGQGTSCHH